VRFRAAVLAALRPVLHLVAQREKRVLVRDRHQHDVSTPPPDTAVRAAPGTWASRRKLAQPFPPSPPLTRIFDLVERTSTAARPANGGRASALADRRHHGHELLPRPVVVETDHTVYEGIEGVIPRQRYIAPGLPARAVLAEMIVPPRTAWPPNTFTPSRWELLSRPFRLEPWPFLCAILLDSLSGLDGVDPHGRVGLAVTPRAPVVLPLLVL